MHSEAYAIQAVSVGSAGSVTFEEAFPELRRGLRHRASYLGRVQVALDVAQETLVRAYTRWASLRAYPAPEAWVARVASNLAIDELRRVRRFRRGRVTPATDNNQDDTRDRTIAVQTALAKAPTRGHRPAVFLGLTEAETAAALSCSIGAVKQHAFRAKHSMRSELGLRFLEEE